MTQKRTWIVLALAALAVLVAVLLINQGREEAPVNTSLRAGCIPIADCGQLFVALDQGYFDEEGLSVTIENLAGGAPILEALAAGSLDVGFSNVVSLIQARRAGLDFIALTGGPAEDGDHREHAILVPATSAIRDVRGLAGRKLAVNTRKNIDELMVTLLLQKYGVDPSSVHLVEIPFPRMLGTLQGGNVDAIAAIEPYVSLGLADQQNRVLTYNYLEVDPTTEISTYVVTQRWLSSNPSVASKFKKALNRATAFANANPDELRQSLSRHTSLSLDQLANVELPLFTDTLSEVRLDGMIKRVHEIGWIDQVFPADELLDHE